MRYTNILLEYDRSKTLANYIDAVEKRMRQDRNAFTQWQQEADEGMGLADFAMDKFEAVDPTSKKMFVRYLVHWYATGSMRYLEDASKAHDAIMLFVKFANKIKSNNALYRKEMAAGETPTVTEISTDFSRMTFSEFLDLGDELGGVKSKAVMRREEEQVFYDTRQADLVYNGPDMKIVSLKSQEAANYFGRSTRWCTTSENDSMFDHYIQSGPLFVILFKGEDRRWQFQFETDQFMDERDEELHENAPLFKKVMKHFQKYLIDRFTAKHRDMPGMNIRFVENPSDEVCIAAVAENSSAIRVIDNPSDRVIKAAIEYHPNSIKNMIQQPEWAQELVVSMNGSYIKWVYEPTEKIQLMAIARDPSNINNIVKPSLAAQLAAVRADGYQIANIAHPSPEVQMAAVQQSTRSLQYIDYPDEAVCLYCVQKNGMSIAYLKGKQKYLTPEVQRAAVSNNPEAISFITNPTPEVQKIALKARSASLRLSREPY
jgi:hypothetical protein